MFSGPWEILLILAIALLLFGSKKIRTLGSDLGAGLKGFKKSLIEIEKPIEFHRAHHEIHPLLSPQSELCDNILMKHINRTGLLIL